MCTLSRKTLWFTSPQFMGAACENRKRLEPAQEAVHKGAKELNRRVPATTVSGA